MKKIVFGQNGEAIDEATGEIIGKKDSSGRIMFDQEKMKSLQNNSTESNDGPKDEKLKEEQNEIKTISKNSIVKPDVKYTKYEISPDSEFTVKFCLGFEEDGRITAYKEDSYLRIEGLEQHWAKFRMWTFKEELDWKSQCMEFDSVSRSFKQNILKLNEIKIRKLIKDWSFASVDSKFKLLHVDGVLSDESYNVMMGFNPVIMDNLIVLMNNALE